jgi:hypothetical protein
MGGIWGLAAATALENLPVEVRGLASGVLQQGYAVGYLIAAGTSTYGDSGIQYALTILCL